MRSATTALNAMLRRFHADPEAYTATIHGAGRAFSTGADVHHRQLRKRGEFERLGGPQGHGAHAPDPSCTRSIGSQ
jgi:enoyl-CoA hydratase/carnithine racemase